MVNFHESRFGLATWRASTPTTVDLIDTGDQLLPIFGAPSVGAGVEPELEVRVVGIAYSEPLVFAWSTLVVAVHPGTLPAIAT
jgi:hypothetical protein